MEFSDPQKKYIEKVSKELVEKVKIYLSSISESDNLPNEHYISIEPQPNPELFWNQKFHFAINLCFPPSKSRHVFMYIEVILWDKFAKVSTGIADEDFIKFITLLDKADISIKIENKLYNLIEKVESL